MRRHAQDQPERKGSELNDTHLLCLAPYADRTFVDKRTLESARRARNKSPMFEGLTTGVARARDCAELAAVLNRASPEGGARSEPSPVRAVATSSVRWTEADGGSGKR